MEFSAGLGVLIFMMYRALNRREMLRRSLFGSAAISLASMPAWAFAEELIRTPRQTEGPFYPDRLPLDTDNDLLIINDSIDQAVGEIAHLTGRILDGHGEPIRNALVEIWQCDAKGHYIHSRDRDMNARGESDGHFQGFGRFLTGSDGGYYFRTIKPVAYPGRTPHIHIKIKRSGKDLLTTQCYVKGEPQNARDGVLRGIRDARQRDSVQVDFTPIEHSKIGELAATFDVVLGFTPDA